MPNWCFNRLRVTGPATAAARFQKQAVGFQPWLQPEHGEAPEVLTFHHLVPVPPEVLAAGYAPAGYAWEREHWGCNSGARQVEVREEWEGGVLYEFDTAWIPPLSFLKEVSRQWPDLAFVLDYEELLAGFKGLARAAAGVLEHYWIDLYPADR